MTVKIEIIRSRGNYVVGAILDIDAQVAHQLEVEGVAKILRQTTHQSTKDLVTASGPADLPVDEPEDEKPKKKKASKEG